MDFKVTIIVLCVIVVLIVAICCGWLIYKKRVEFVVKNSEKLKKLYHLNNEFSFYHIEKKYDERIECNSKRVFDKFNLDNALKNILLKKENYYISDLYYGSEKILRNFLNIVKDMT